MMGKGVDIRILGDKELERKFASLAVKIQKKLAKAAIGVAIKEVLKRAKQLVPVKSGALRDSLHIKSLKGRGKIIGYRVSTGSRETLGIDAKDKYFFPAAVEFGHGNVSAKPFIRPAIDSQKSRLLGIIASELGGKIEEEARNGNTSGAEDASTSDAAARAKAIRENRRGKRGGIFYINSKGNKVYIRKNK